MRDRSPYTLLVTCVLWSAFFVCGAPLRAQDQDETARLQGTTRDALYEELSREAEFVDRQYGLLKRVVQVVQPSVVHIQANKTSRGSNNSLTRIEEAGAGVIVEYKDQSYVVTNRHVIADAGNDNIRIQLADGRFFNPTEVRTDPDSDVAVMYVDEAELLPARYGDSDRVDMGDFVVAVGSPFGLSHSVSYGIISAKGRRDLELGTTGVRYQDFIQTDAAINPGNSGGPLLNLRGEVIGINTAIASNSGGNDGIGFTIPSNMVNRIVSDLIEFGSVRRGWIGVTLDSAYTPEKARALGLNSAFGARVSAIYPEAPASKTDLRRGDVILYYDGKQIINDSHLVNDVSMTVPGKRVTLVVYRDGRQESIAITIGQREPETP